MRLFPTKHTSWPVLLLVSLLAACNFPGTSVPKVAATIAPTADQVLAASKFALPELAARFPSPPIVPIPKSNIQMGGDSFDAYQTTGDRFRVLCKQPCAFDERMMDALYAIYKVTAQADVRTAGFDVLDKFSVLDIHLDRDNVCTQYEGELGLTTSYPNNPDSIVICLYVTTPENQDSLQSNTTTSFTPEGVIRSGGLGVFAHEYAHALLFGRFASSHDFVYPIEYMTFNPDDVAYYGDLCQSLYQNNSPLSYQLCQTYGFTFLQMIRSLLDINQLYEDGFGNLQGGMVGYAQYQAILENLLGRDVTQAFTDTGYQKVLVVEGKPAYTLPYGGEACTYQAQLIRDVTIPLGTTLDANAPF